MQSTQVSKGQATESYSDTQQDSANSYPGTQAVARAIGLLKVFSDAQPEWSLTDLAQVTKLNKTTAFRLLAALEAEGLVMRNPLSGGYRLGLELVALGGGAMRSNPLRAVSRPVLELLAQESGEAATLEVLAGSHVLIVDEVSSRHPMGMSQDVGSRLPAHATATGKLLLAYAPEAALNAGLRLPLVRLTDQTIVDLTSLHKQLTVIRHQGYAAATGELEPGFVAVAAPIYDREHQVVAAISVGGSSLRLPPERMLEVAVMVQKAARQVSQQLVNWPGEDTASQGNWPSTTAEAASNAVAFARIDEIDDPPVLSLNQRVHLSAGLLASTSAGYAGPAGDFSPGKTATIDIVVHAANVDVFPNWIQSTKFLEGSDSQLVEFALVPRHPGSTVVVVDFYFERHWLTKVQFEVNVLDAPIAYPLSSADKIEP